MGIRQIVLAGFLSFSWAVCYAAVSQQEAAKLGLKGAELTPLGSIRAGTDDGRVPAWEGGITTPPAGYKKGGWYVDPYGDEQPLFTVTAKNYKQYAQWLTDGQIAMLKAYPDTYFMNVYPSHRSAAFPQWVYDATMRNALEMKLCGERCIVPNEYGGGFPFPIPSGDEQKKAADIFWNGYIVNIQPAVSLYFKNLSGFLVNADGSYTRVAARMQGVNPWWMTGEERRKYAGKYAIFQTPEGKGTNIYCLLYDNIEPPRQGGNVVTQCSWTKNIRVDTWTYVPGQRRVRRMPELGVYDAPGNNTDGLRTTDSLSGFRLTGTEERYNYKIHGKKVKLIPYNNYKLGDPNLKEKDVVQPHHLNPKYMRWEFHRVWEIEMNLKEGYRHVSPRRFTYTDEDTWITMLSHMYDNKGDLWRVNEVAGFPAYDVNWYPVWGDAYYDVLNGRYVSGGSTGGWYNFGPNPTPPMFFNHLNLDYVDPEAMTSQGLRSYGIR